MKYKTIAHSIEKPLFDEMHFRTNSKHGQRMKRLRHSTVEPVIGTLVNALSMNKVGTRGIKQATKCMITSAIAYNLKKLMKWGTKKRGAVAIALHPVGEKPCQQQFFNDIKQSWAVLTSLFCQNRPQTEL